MFLIRKIGKTLRGQAKPYQIITAAVLGTLIGFAPPISHAPFYLFGVVLLLAIINANFFIATFTAGIAKLLALVLMPLSFELGMVLVDGPLQPLFRTLINAPVTALMGFDYYVTAGGSVIALILGAGIGIGYIKLISGFRRKMAKVEADSEKYADFVSKRGVRIVMWVLFGGKAKQSYAELMEQKKVGLPVRPLGVVFALLMIGLLFVIQQFFSSQLITTLLKGQLEQFHGATVDVQGVVLDLASGQLSIDQLAMADPDHLETDLIRANQVQATISTPDLLRKRIVIDTIVVDDAVQGAKRDRPGVLIGQRPPKPAPPQEGQAIEDWFAKAKDWKERLDTFRNWLEKLRGPSDDQTASSDEEKGRLRKWAEQYGRADVRAAHLVEGSPTVLVRDTKINKLRASWPEQETLDIHATNLSTHPALAPDKPRVTVVSSENTFDLDIAIAPRAQNDAQSELKLTLRNQSIDETLDDFKLPGDIPLRGGTWQAGVNGDWSDLDGLDLPFAMTLQDTSFVLGNSATPIEQFPIQFAVTGSLDAPSFKPNTEALLAALKQTGNQALINYLATNGAGKLREVLDSELGGAATDLLGNFLGHNNEDQNNSQDEENANDSELGDKIREGIGGFLNRNRDDESR